MQVPGSRREEGGMVLTRSLGRIRVSGLNKFSFRSIELTMVHTDLQHRHTAELR